MWTFTITSFASMGLQKLRQVNYKKLFNFAKKKLIQYLIISFLIIYLENKLDKTINYLLVMEYADGGTLRNYLKNNFKTMTWSDKYNLGYQLAYALTCMHDEGIMHRDLVIILRIYT